MGNVCEYNKSPVPSTLPKSINFHKFLNMLIYLDQGEIKEEEVDVIICQTDVNLQYFPPNFTNNMKLSLQKQLLAELQKLKTINYVYGDVVYTHAQELEFDYVFYCVLPNENKADLKPDVSGQFLVSQSKSTEPPSPFKNKKKKNLANRDNQSKYQKQYISECIIKCMRLADELQINSICFPVFASPLYQFTASQLATIMFLTMKHYIEENQTKMKYLKTIRICVQDPNQLESFTWAFLETFKRTGVQSSTLSDNNSESMSDNGDLDDELGRSLETFEEFKQLKTKNQYKEDDFLTTFGQSYQGKMQGTQMTSDRKGSL